MPWNSDVHMTDVEGRLGLRLLESPLQFTDRWGGIWVTPAGTVSDLSSYLYVGRVLFKNTLLVKTPFQHDDLYRRQPIDPATGKRVTRKKCDIMFLDGAQEEGEIVVEGEMAEEGKGVPKWVAYIHYWGIRAAGWYAFNQYTKALKEQCEADDNA